jgi:hypothetical protein
MDIAQKMSLRKTRVMRMAPIFGEGAGARVHLSEIRYFHDAKELESILEGMKPEMVRTLKEMEVSSGGIRR